MSSKLEIAVAPLAIPTEGLAVIFIDADLAMGTTSRDFLAASGDLVKRAAETDGFKGKAMSFLEILAPAGLPVSRLIIAGLGKAEDYAKTDWVKFGGAIMGKMPASTASFTVLGERPDGAMAPEALADLSMGMRLRAYSFDRYKTKKKDKDEAPEPKTIKAKLACAEPAATKSAIARTDAIADGVLLARDLINEPPNVIHPESFADKASALEELGIKIDILDEKAMKKLGMGSLLAVGQGSERESRLVVMRWNGGGDAQPVAFVGKGVTFDTGGISIKPAGSMEDMKGDMAGAACVTGLMLALASRKAKANVIGAIGLVENMPDGKSYRPGDILTSMSGQTIEVVNTDAEGRLVLADVLWYIQDKYKPRFMVNLATLTGAILVALGKEYAGLFSNSDELSQRLFEVGTKTGEKVWRLPLGAEYDKMIDSKFADMKNTGGRDGGSITAAQFLQRFVNETPWAHLDIAGTGMAASNSDINKSWGPGWGVRLLDRLVADHYES